MGRRSIPLIGEFLTYLFLDKQLVPGTVAGYRSAILFPFKHTDLPDVGHDPALTALLASLSRERLRRLRFLLQWDLSLVLMALTRAHFELLQLAAPTVLAWKVFFLVLLASGATAKGVQHDKWKSVSLFPHPSFISKTQLSAEGA